MRKNLVKKHWLLKEQTSNGTASSAIGKCIFLKKKKKSPQNTHQVADMQ